jgi:hypothetical protein
MDSTAGSVLVNIDAAIFASSRKMGADIVIRDHNGSMRRLLYLSWRKLELFFSRIIIVSDCLSVMQCVLSTTTDRLLCGLVIGTSSDWHWFSPPVSFFMSFVV